MGFDRDPAIHDLIAKRSIENTASDTQYGQANRFHNWCLVAETVFMKDPIEFYSQRMKARYAYPDFRKCMVLPKTAKIGKEAREILKINDK